MSDTHLKLLQDLVAGRVTVEALKPHLGVHCQIEQKCDQTWKRAGSDEKVHRIGHRITGCQNPNQNTDWLWGDWEDGQCTD